jgi:hypothetical protein
MRLTSLRIVAIAIALASSGCAGSNVDLAATLKVGDLTTGWFDAGIVNGQNKLVPSAAFTVTNTGSATLNGLQIYTVFRYLNETEELGSSLMVLRGAEALGPGATSKLLVSRANWGFTGEQPRGQMLTHAKFKDAKVEVFAKFGSATFVRLTQTQLKRQLLTQ